MPEKPKPTRKPPPEIWAKVAEKHRQRRETRKNRLFARLAEAALMEPNPYATEAARQSAELRDTGKLKQRKLTRAEREAQLEGAPPGVAAFSRMLAESVKKRPKLRRRD